MDKYSVLKKYFGFSSFRSNQEAIINHLFEKRHCLVLMPTGMGKSLCYQIPALCLEGLTIVISPLIALMKDQVDSLCARGIDAVFINSSLKKPQRESRYQGIRDGKYKLLYVTPERFRKKEFINVITKREISLLAIDEAHCISQWGHDFRPDYMRLSEFRKTLKNPLTIALTATATPEIQKDIIRQLNLKPKAMKIFHEGIYRPNLKLTMADVYEEKEKLCEILETLPKYPGNQIIYFTLIKTLDRFSELLRQSHVRHLCYHGKLDPSQRRRIQEKFMGGSNQLILATNAFGMGVDKEDVRLVIHAEITSSPESYYQEIGRAGRDGKTSLCHLIYCEQDLATQMEFIRWRNPDAAFIKNTFDLIKKLGKGVNSYDYEHLQSELVYKNRGDHRLATALSLLDRYHVTEGDLEKSNLQLISDLPKELTDEEKIQGKKINSLKKLHSMLEYIKLETCRKEFLHKYFGVPAKQCGNCDLCETEQ